MLIAQTQRRVARVLADLDLARQHARVSLQRLDEAAGDLAQLDSELQGSSDLLEHLRLALACRHAAEVYSSAEQQAVDAVFGLRMIENAIASAGAAVRGA